MEALGSLSAISFPSASRGRRLREKCLPPINNVIICDQKRVGNKINLPPRVNFLNLPPRPRPAPGGPPGAIL